MLYDHLDEDNFLLYAAKHYDNAQCHDINEFYEDLKRIKYVKKLITRYKITGELKDRLILNHLIILNNVFGPESLSKILFLKMYKEMKYLKPFLILLHVLPSVVCNVGKDSKNYSTDEIPMDEVVIQALRKIGNG